MPRKPQPKPPAAEVFRKFAEEKDLDVEVQSAGTDTDSFDDQAFLRANWGVERTTQLTNEMLAQADIVVALNPWVEKEIRAWYKPPEKITVLNVPDRFSLHSGNLDELYKILNQQLKPLAEELLSKSEGKRPNKEVL